MLIDDPVVKPAPSLVLSATDGADNLHHVAGVDLGTSPCVPRNDFAVNSYGDLLGAYVKAV